MPIEFIRLFPRHRKLAWPFIHWHKVWNKKKFYASSEILSENNTQTGSIAINWTANNIIPTGVYILKIKANEQVISKKIIFANWFQK